MRIITVARKPLSESNVASNVLKHGCGGINIEECRVGLGDDRSGDTAGGRWPANLIFQHRSGCKHVGTKRVTGSGTSKTFHDGYKGKSVTGFVRGHSHPGNQHADKDGKETVAAWKCVSGCPIKELDTQSGVQKSGVAGGKSRAWGAGGEVVLSSSQDGVGWKAYNSEGYGDKGGASRFFKQVKEG